MSIPNYRESSFSHTITLKGVSYADAIPRVRAALASEGFGVLTEIDIKAVMKKKLDVDEREYLILGACNPGLAHRALSALPAVGVLLPCNVVVTVDDASDAVVSFVDPVAMFAVADAPEVAELAAEVGSKLGRALASLASS